MTTEIVLFLSEFCRRRFYRLLQHSRLPIPQYLQLTLRREAYHHDAEYPFVKAHPGNVTARRCGNSGRRLKPRNDIAGPPIAPDSQPLNDEVTEGGQKCEGLHQPRVVIAEPPSPYLCGGWWSNVSLRPSDDDRQPFSCGEPTRCRETQISHPVAPDCPSCPPGTRGTGVAGRLDRLDSTRQHDRGRRMTDRKLPTIARDVPVQFVMLLEKPDLPVRAIGERVAVPARCKQAVPVAHVDPDSVVHRP